MRLDLDTYRTVPWDDDVPFFLGHFVDGRRRAAARLPAPDAAPGARAGREAGLCGDGGRRSTSSSISPRRRRAGPRRRAWGPRPMTPGHVRLLAAAHEPLRASTSTRSWTTSAPSACPSRACTPRRGPGVYEAAIVFSGALEAADRALLFKTGAKEIGARFGIMPSLHGQVEPAVPGLLAATCTRACRTARRTSSTTPGAAHGDVEALRELPRRPGRLPHGVRADVLADGELLQAPRRRLLGAGEADLGRRQPHRQLPRDRRQPEGHPPGDALPRRRHEPLPGDGRRHRRGPARRREGPQAHRAADHRHQRGRRKHPARAALAHRDDARSSSSRQSRATGWATSSSTTSPPRASGNGGSGRTPSPTGS